MYLGQVLLNDIIPHLRCIQLRVESSSDHWHNVIDAAQARLFSQQIPAQAHTKTSVCLRVELRNVTNDQLSKGKHCYTDEQLHFQLPVSDSL